ncbi:MAG TPA: IS91 family transposase, partial [Acidobacteria bacterium]|nr:IS91 family transposase [Acidobacteriota bacterium]
MRSSTLKCTRCPRFSLHAATRIDADDRAGLKTAGPLRQPHPLAAGRLQIIDDEHLYFRLKSPGRTVRPFVVLSPLELIEKLVAQVPPRLNLIRYHGVLVPNARDRHHIVPDARLTDVPAIEPAAVDNPQARPHRLSWAALLARVF